MASTDDRSELARAMRAAGMSSAEVREALVRLAEQVERRRGEVTAA